MEITFNEIQKIADTLPIGYYAKKRVKVECSKTEETSYYNPVEEKICVAYYNIIRGLNGLNNESDKEKVVRNFLYHEVSHAILTPKDLLNGTETELVAERVNIFEDERIETLLKDFYLDVNFKENVKRTCGDSYNNVPSSPMEAFFQTVRFRKGHPIFIKRVEEIVEKYKLLSQNSPTNNWYKDMVLRNGYRNDIDRLYHDISKHYNSNKEEYERNEFISVPTLTKDSSYTENEIECINEQIEKELCECEEKDRNGGLISKLFEKTINCLIDTKLTEQLENYIRSFNKKNSNGGCLNAYSGTINPRSCNRTDYRFFERSASTRGMNKFGTFHLNLFIDCSGSFAPNVPKVNTLLKSLLDIERRNPNFSFDLVRCEYGEKLAEKNDRQIFAGGGNELDGECLKIYRKLQKSNTYNFNIALFDGFANPIESGFSAFNFNNCVVIAEKDNKKYIEKQCPKAKVYYSNDNYAEELTDKILKAFAIAFR